LLSAAILPSKPIKAIESTSSIQKRKAEEKAILEVLATAYDMFTRISKGDYEAFKTTWAKSFTEAKDPTYRRSIEDLLTAFSSTSQEEFASDFSLGERSIIFTFAQQIAALVDSNVDAHFHSNAIAIHRKLNNIRLREIEKKDYLSNEEKDLYDNEMNRILSEQNNIGNGFNDLYEAPDLENLKDETKAKYEDVMKKAASTDAQQKMKEALAKKQLAQKNQPTGSVQMAPSKNKDKEPEKNVQEEDPEMAEAMRRSQITAAEEKNRRDQEDLDSANVQMENMALAESIESERERQEMAEALKKSRDDF
jgi:hypothetical protein